MLDDSYLDDHHDADIEQAELEAAGRASGRGHRKMLALCTAGRFADAARACHHGAGYPTDSPAATNANDYRAGQPGHRCTNCGSWFSAEQVKPITDRCGVDLRQLRALAPAVPCERRDPNAGPTDTRGCGACGAIQTETHADDCENKPDAPCPAQLPWARTPCPNTASANGGPCDECRAVLNECATDPDGTDAARQNEFFWS